MTKYLLRFVDKRTNSTISMPLADMPEKPSIGESIFISTDDNDISYQITDIVHKILSSEKSGVTSIQIVIYLE